MNIIIPMAGVGKRLRPFTLTTHKPLIKIAGKSIVSWLIEKLTKVTKSKITDVAFIIGDFPEDVVIMLKEVGKLYDFIVHIFYQKEALGTAHAISIAKSLLVGEVIVAFADTLFDADFEISYNSDVVIWTKVVENPQLYGVVIKDSDKNVIAFKEKPKEFISNEAIIGIYYFKNSELLASKINYLLSNNIVVNGEFQLTDVLQMLLDDGLKFTSQNVNEWLDCGNKDLLINTMAYVCQNFETNSNSPKSENSILIQPVYIGKNVNLKNSIIGPNVSIEDNTTISNSFISNSIILENCNILNANFKNTMIGNYVEFNNISQNLDLGDYTKIKI